ncbi:MAG: DoxX family protein [Synechococcaceae cyanobacterium]|nr:DoxX family protein [Synechococcaceae cyanobacterium]
MTSSTRIPSPLLDGLARILLCLVFVNALLGKFGGFAATAAMMAERGLPLARVLLVLAMVLMGVGSILVISGVRQRLGVLLLLVFLVPTTLIFHTDLGDPMQRIAFFKNLAIMGGLLLVANRPGAT